MKKFILTIMVLSVFSVAQAQLMGGEGAPNLKQGDIIIGGKLALGAVYGANVGFIAGAEYGFMEGFLAPPKFNTSLGIGLSLGYSSHDDYDVDYSDILILASGYWHINLIKKEQVDTYVVINSGLDISNSPNNTNFHPTGGAGVGIRYYFIPKLSGVAEAGFGMGILRVGLDFKL